MGPLIFQAAPLGGRLSSRTLSPSMTSRPLLFSRLNITWTERRRIAGLSDGPKLRSSVVLPTLWALVMQCYRKVRKVLKTWTHLWRSAAIFLPFSRLLAILFLECQKLYSLINKADIFIMNASLLDVFWHLFVFLALLGFATSCVRQVFTCFIISGLSDLELISVYRLYFWQGTLASSS